MSEGQDWLEDPLMKISEDRFKYLVPKGLDDEQNKMWQGFHFSTRLKLEAAGHFCGQLRSAASMPDDLGLPLLAHGEFKWYDAFFFELMSAYDILLHELNIVFASHLNLNPEKISGPAIKDALPEKLADYMAREWRKPWFEKLRQYRNTATHYSYALASSWKSGTGGKTWDYDMHEVSMFYLDRNTGKTITEDVSECSIYLRKMVEHVCRVWEEMAKAFDTKYVDSAASAYVLSPYVEGP